MVARGVTTPGDGHLRPDIDGPTTRNDLHAAPAARYQGTVNKDDDDAAALADHSPRFDVWVCAGRLCRANGADLVTHACAHALDGQPRARLQRGGCYGLCDLGPNVIVRRQSLDGEVDVEADRLSLTDNDNEFVSCGVGPADVSELLGSFLALDQPLLRLSRAVKESALAPRSTIEARMRALRTQRRNKS